MELIGTLVYYSLGLMNIFLLIYIIRTLLSNAKIYPFNKTDPYTESLFISCILIHQLIYFLYSHNIYLDDIKIENICLIISSFFDHFLCFIPLIIKINAVAEVFKYSYLHLSYDYSNNIESKEDKEKYENIIENSKNNHNKKVLIYEKFYQKRAKNPNPDFKRALIIFIIIILLVSGLLSMLYYYIPYNNCIV